MNIFPKLKDSVSSGLVQHVQNSIFNLIRPSILTRLGKKTNKVIAVSMLSIIKLMRLRGR